MSEWISVEDRLPEYGDPILLVVGGNIQLVTYIRDGADNSDDWAEPFLFDHDDHMKIWWRDVSHWMPLPAYN